MEAVAALWEQPETEVEAVHLAIALAYHGLLRQPSRTETSDMTPRKTPLHPSGRILSCGQSHYLKMASLR